MGKRYLCRFKQVRAFLSLDAPWAKLTLAPRLREDAAHPWVEDDATGCWLAWTGVWIHRDGLVDSQDGDALLRRYLEVGGERLGLELQGQFALLIGDARAKEVVAITDRCGSLHLFAAAIEEGYALSTSSAVLSAWLGGAGNDCDRFDPVGLHQFVATGVVYDDRTIWSNVKKLGAGMVSSFGASGIRQQRYWHFADLEPESVSLDQAVERVHEQLVRSVKQISRAFPEIVSDLTGGYDSRALLCGLLNSGVKFDTTVSGPLSSPDVAVSTRLAQRLSIHHTPQGVPPAPTAEELAKALTWTDGEYDIFDYARIAATHVRLSQQYKISLNGSFGEIARGYWWELIWPQLTEKSPLSGEMVSRKRFAAIPYDKSIFAPAARLDLRECLAEVLDRTVSELRHFPKSSQMDAMYYYQRMSHWQGRIVSSTNQIWPCSSPFSFSQILEPILQCRASGRIRSGLVRTLFERHHPVLARIPLEHGYPPRPLTIFNFWQFYPLVEHYAGLVRGKLAPRITSFFGARRSSAFSGSPPALGQRFENIFGGQGFGIEKNSLLLAESGLFDDALLKTWFDPSTVLGEGKIEQWRRLVSLELLLRRLREIRLD